MKVKKEVFNVDVQSTRPDGYRRGGFELKRGINKLFNVSKTSLALLNRDKSVAILDCSKVPPVEPFDDVQNSAGALLATDQNAQANAGANILADSLTAAQIAALFWQLAPEQFTQSGLPDTKALSAIAGATVTAAQRDEAWALHQAAIDAGSNVGTGQD